jgi:hypothetical protein
MDLKKEIHLSDLFKRRPKDDAGSAKLPKPPKAEKPTKRVRKEKTAKPRKQTPGFVARTAPPLRQVPLMRPFNLLPKELPRQAGDRRALVPYALVALLGVLVFAGLAAFYLRASADVADKQGTYDDLRTELASLEVPAKDPLSGQRTGLAAEKTARTNALAGTLGTRVAFDRLLRELALVLPEGVALVQLAAQSPTAASVTPAVPTAPTAPAGPVQSFTIVGETTDQRLVALSLARLSLVPDLSAVTLVNSTEDPAQNIINFTIKASVRQEGTTA